MTLRPHSLEKTTILAPMQKLQFVVCGFIHDEAIGMPSEGVEPGTRWADIPENRECPDCGVAKSEFEMVEIR